jgi:tRNA pseudouridine55 synthase
VAVRSLVTTHHDPAAATLTLELTVSKGYYVRALARDLGEGLDVPCHLAALRRLASGAFAIDEAVAPDADDLGSQLLPLSTAARRAMPVARLTTEGTQRARHGGPMSEDDFETPPPSEGTSAWLDPLGELVAVGGRKDGRPQVNRGFAAPVSPDRTSQ